MGIIELSNIKVYAYHGCLKEETKIGSDYLVNIAIEADLTKAATTDTLVDTADYVHINHIVKEEMAIAAKLLEHVADRIIKRVLLEIKIVSSVSVTVSKINPPIGGDVEKVSIKLKQTR